MRERYLEPMRVALNKCLDDIYAFAALCIVIIMAALFLGGGVIGVLICFCLWATILPEKMNEQLERLPSNRKAVWKRIAPIVYLYPAAIFIAQSIAIYSIFYAFKDNHAIASYVYESNRWFSSLMYEFVPTIREQVDLSKVRGDIIWKYYVTFYAIVFTSLPLIMVAATVNYKSLRSAPEDQIRFVRKRYQTLAGRILGLIFVFMMLAFSIDQPEIKTSAHPLRNYDASLNDKHFVLLLTNVSISYIAYMFLVGVFQNIQSISRGKKEMTFVSNAELLKTNAQNLQLQTELMLDHAKNVLTNNPNNIFAQTTHATMKIAGKGLGILGIALDGVTAEHGQTEAAIASSTIGTLTSIGFASLLPATALPVGATIVILNVGYSIFIHDTATNAIDDVIDTTIAAIQTANDTRQQVGGETTTNLGTLQFKTDVDAKSFTIVDTNTNMEYKNLYNDNAELIGQSVFDANTGVGYSVNDQGVVTASDGSSVFTEDISGGAVSQQLQDIFDQTTTGTPSLADQVEQNNIDTLEAETGSDQIDTSSTLQRNDDGQYVIVDEHGDSTVYNERTGDLESYLNNAGSGHNSDSVVSVQTSDGGFVSFVSEGAEAVVDGISYVVSEIADAVEAGAEALGAFISAQVDDISDWFSNEQGLQLDFANWFALNVADLANGTLDPEDAFIDFANYVANQYLGSVVTSAVNRAGADNLVKEVLGEFGITGDEATVLSNSFSSVITRVGVELFASGGEWDTETMTDIAIAATASIVAQHYAFKYFGGPDYDILSPDLQAQIDIQVGATVAAVTTFVTGLFDSGDYNQADWVFLGVNTGIAAAAAGGASYVSGLVSLGSLAGPAGAAVAVIIGIIGSSIIGSIYKGVSYGPGEFESPSAALNTQYQVIEMEVDNGDGTTSMVDALVAVNSAGSTIIAEDITHIIGGNGHDTLIGSDPDNVINGGAGDDYIQGHDGVDALVGDAGGDHIIGNEGDDILDGGAGDDELFGGDGNDTIIGGDGYDFIMGEGDDDIIHSGAGRDIVMGGLGDDVIDTAEGNDLVDAGEGDDVVIAGAGDDLVMGNLGNDIIEGGEGADRLFGEDGNDTIRGGAGRDYINGGAGINVLSGGAGADSIVGGFEDDFLDGEIGNDRLDGGDGNDTLEGGLDDDLLVGGIGDDILNGGDGNDNLVAGMGSDTLDGGAGDDVYVFSAGDGSNTITADASGSDTIGLIDIESTDITFTEDGDDLVISYGADEVRITGQLNSAIVETLELQDGTVDLNTISFTGGVASFTFNASAENVLTQNVIEETTKFETDTLSWDSEISQNQIIKNIGGFSYIEAIRQDPASVTINAPSVESYHKYRGKFFGKKFGKYTVFKLEYDDVLNTRDVYQYDLLDAGDDGSSYSSVVTGAYKVTTTFTHTFKNKVGNIEITDVFLGDTHVASFKEGEYFYNSGRYANTGVTYMDIGQKQLIVDDGDVLYTTAQDRLALGVSENVSLGVRFTAENHDQIIGTHIDESISGGTGNDILYGGGGSDTLNGQSGDDWIFGNSDSDTIFGGFGDDILHGGSVGDTMDGGDGDDGLIGAGGDDNMTGGQGDDWLDGGEGDDTLNGGSTGDDTLIGGEGVDTFIYSNGVDHIWDIDEGDQANFITIDSFSESDISEIIVDDSGNVRIVFTSGVDEVVIHNYTAFGTTGSITDVNGAAISIGTTVNGTTGDDVLTGTFINDTVFLGAGADTYTYISGRDIIHETDSSTDNDVIHLQNFSVRDILDIRIENTNDLAFILSEHKDEFVIKDALLYGRIETITGNDAYELDLTQISQWMVGTNDGETLEGDYYNQKDEFVVAGAGDDTVILWGGNDTVYAGDGNDYVNGRPMDDLIYGGNGNDSLRGAQGDDFIHGGAGNDVLRAEIDSDVLYGGKGNDTFKIAQGTHTLYEYQDEGTDTIRITAGMKVTDITDVSVENIDDVKFSFEDGSYFIAVDNLLGDRIEFIRDDTSIRYSLDDAFDHSNTDYFAGTADDDIYFGLGGADVLSGQDGDDILHGGDGNDRVYGHADNDYLYGNQGNDLLSVTSGNNHLDGGDGSDRIYTGSGSDYVHDSGGSDRMYDGAGDHTYEFGKDYDRFYDGAGSDTYVAQEVHSTTDVIYNFTTTGTEADVLDISSILDLQSGDVLADYLTLTESNGNTIVSIDQDGSGSVYAAQDTVRLDSVTGLDINTMITNGTLVV